MKDFLKRFIIVIIFLIGVMVALILANLYIQSRNNKPTENKVEEQQVIPVEEKETDEIEKYKETYGINTANLNLRDYPSTDGKVLEVIPKISNLNILAKIRNGWYKVSYGKNTGYVSGDYVSILTDEQKKEIVVNKKYSDNTYAKTEDSLNIRARANKDSDILTTVNSGSVLRVYEKMQNGWYKVEGNAKVGYVDGQYLKVLSDEEYKALSSDTNNMLKPDQNIIATYTATSSYGESSRYNMHVAADYINGTVIKPGQTYSHLATIFPDSKENKYVDSYVQVNGKVEMGNGGGVCMTSSVLYASIVSATEQGVNTGLIVTMRKPHTNPVKYVPVKYEATVAGPSLDFSFRNVNPYSVKLEASYDYNTLTITIYKV